MIIDLLKYTAFLRPQLRVTIDFSVLQAVISWMQEALRSAPVHLPGITRSAALLSHAVAPTSGLGLTDIWSSWRGSVNLNSYAPELEQVISNVDDNEDGYSGSHLLLKFRDTASSIRVFSDGTSRESDHFHRPEL